MKILEKALSMVRRWTASTPQSPPRRSRFRPCCEELEPRTLMSTMLQINNQTNLDLDQYDIWAAGYSTASDLYLNESGSFVSSIGRKTIPIQKINLGFTITLDQDLIGGIVFVIVTPKGVKPAEFARVNSTHGGVSPPPIPPFVVGQTNAYYPNDFFEVTVEAGKVVVDTSQVTQFSIPLTLAALDDSGATLDQVGVAAPRSAIGGAYYAFVEAEDAAAYHPLLYFWPERSIGIDYYSIISPTNYLVGNPDSTLKDWWNSTLDTLFSTTTPLKFSIRGDVNHTDATQPPLDYNGTVVTAPNGSVAIELTAGGETYYIYDPRSQYAQVTKNFGTAAHQVFGNVGVFNDPTSRSGANSTDGTASFLQQAVVAALNRGVALAAPQAPTPSGGSTSAYWGTATNWYPSGSTYNVYAKFLHTGTVDGTHIFINGRAYGFGYDENPTPIPPAPAGQPHVSPKFEPLPPGTTHLVVTLGPWLKLGSGGSPGGGGGDARLVDGHLLVNGTAGNDVIRILKASRRRIQVILNGESLGTFAPTGSIYVNGLAGDDCIVGQRVQRKMVIDGGQGDDFIVGGRRSDRIFGSFGDDLLVGGGGRDQLDGGTGSNKIFNSHLPRCRHRH